VKKAHINVQEKPKMQHEMAKNDDTLISQSPNHDDPTYLYLFVLSCLVIAFASSFDPTHKPIDLVKMAQPVILLSWPSWIAVLISSFMMFKSGLPSVRHQVSALFIGFIGSISILAIAEFQVSQ